MEFNHNDLLKNALNIDRKLAGLKPVQEPESSQESGNDLGTGTGASDDTKPEGGATTPPTTEAPAAPPVPEKPAKAPKAAKGAAPTWNPNA